MSAKKIRCAIYTRKSSEEGLEQEFNSLHAQREACESFITSQKHEGWIAVKTTYDDGGYSGGSMNRPALQTLIADIKEGKIDSVVVYKIDRLTRSLMDFSKLVEVFDQHQVTFVSVTQSFNTTTSMGRLTLNVLLSFAQFEREVTGERIRDKIAASRKKGLWMGGAVPAGYDLRDRQLVANPSEAKNIQQIFALYATHGSVKTVFHCLKQYHIVSPQRVSASGKISGKAPYSRGNIYRILRNPIYIGKVRHKDNIYNGTHEAIIDHELWQRVQTQLDTSERASEGSVTKSKTVKRTNLLKGKLFDPDDVPYTPIYTKKGTIRYRYYISHNLLQYKDHPKRVIARIPATEIETIIVKSLEERLADHHYLQSIWPDQTADTVMHVSKYMQSLNSNELVSSIQKIIIYPDNLLIMISENWIRNHVKQHLSVTLMEETNQEYLDITVPYQVKRGQSGAVMLEPTDKIKSRLDLSNENLKRLVRGMIWREEHFNGKPLLQIARANNCSWTYVNKCIDYSFTF